MKHLIVAAHPLADSVTMKLAVAYAHELELLRHEWIMHDLYRLNFNPVLAAEELDPIRAPGQAPNDVRQAQLQVLDAEVLTVIYPLWWASMPAILKGYIDRVFARGFAYEGGAGNTRGLLNGKGCLLITLSGSPLRLMQGNGEWSAIELLQDRHIFQSCGFELLEHLHFDVIEPPTTEAALSCYVEQVRACARRQFTGPGLNR